MVSLLVATKESPQYNPEASIMYRFELQSADPSTSQPAALTGSARIKATAEQLSHVLARGAGGLSAEASAPEDFMRLLTAEPSVDVLRTLLTALKTRKDSWLRLFIEMEGLDQLADVLSVKARSQKFGDDADEGALLAIKCIKVLVNERFGLHAALETKDFVKSLALCMDGLQGAPRAKLPKPLAAMCCSSAKGHALVLEAMDAVKARRRDQQRFKGLIKWLGAEEDCDIKADVLTFINVIVNFPMELTTRVALRSEFIALGIAELLSGVEMMDHPALNQQLAIFHEEQKQDELDDAVLKTSRGDPVELARQLIVKWKDAPAASAQLSHMLKELLRAPDGEAVGNVDAFVTHLATAGWAPVPWSGGSSGSGSAVQMQQRNSGSSGTGAHAAVDSKALEQLQRKHETELQSVVKSAEMRVQAMESKFKSDLDAMMLEKDAELRRLRARLERAQQGDAPAAAAPQRSGRAPMSPFSPVLAVMDATQAAHGLATPVRGRSQLSMSALAAPEPVADAESAGGAAPPPPPPPPGGAPPPPPPMMSKAVGGSSKPKVVLKTKKLHWPALPAARVAGTVWQSMDPSRTAIDTFEVESLFAAAQRSTDASAKGDAAADAAPADAKVRFFDSKRANNIGIMMSQFRGVDVAGLVHALRVGDEQVLTLERVAQLSKFCPSEEEERLLCAYEGPLDSLGKVELFFLHLLAIPRLRVRLEALEFKLRFDEAVCGVYARLDALNAACREINTSRSLVQTLELVLALGNFMNHGQTRVSESHGFDMTFLAKLGDTKSTNDKSTFLHYLAHLMQRQGIVTTIVSELQSLEAAAQVALDPTVAEMAALKRGLALVMRESNAILEDNGAGDVFASALKDFHAVADDVLAKCSALLEHVRVGMETMRSRFGLAPTTTVEEVLAVVCNFLLGLQKCVKDNAREDRMREAEAKKAARGGRKPARPLKPVNDAHIKATADMATLRFAGVVVDLPRPSPSALSDDATMDGTLTPTKAQLSAALDENTTPKRKGNAMAAMYKDIQHGAMTGRRRKSAEGNKDRKTLRDLSEAANFKRAASFGGALTKK